MKRTPLKRKTPLKAKRKPAKPTALKRYHAYVAQMPCCGCGSWPVEVHHVISDGFKRLTKDHRLVLPCCPLCHRSGPTALHVIGTRKWNALHGFAQHERALALWEAFDGP